MRGDGAEGPGIASLTRASLASRRRPDSVSVIPPEPATWTLKPCRTHHDRLRPGRLKSIEKRCDGLDALRYLATAFRWASRPRPLRPCLSVETRRFDTNLPSAIVGYPCCNSPQRTFDQFVTSPHECAYKHIGILEIPFAWLKAHSRRRTCLLKLGDWWGANRVRCCLSLTCPPARDAFS